MTQDHRSFSRVPLSVPVEYEGMERFRPDKTLNISAGGVFILTPKPLPLKGPLSLSFTLPELASKTVRVKGRVTWIAGGSGSKGGHHPKGMAVAFDAKDKDTRLLLDQYVTVTRAMRTMDDRIGSELPAHQRSELSKPEGKPVQLDLSDIAPQLKV